MGQIVRPIGAPVVSKALFGNYASSMHPVVWVASDNLLGPSVMPKLVPTSAGSPTLVRLPYIGRAVKFGVGGSSDVLKFSGGGSGGLNTGTIALILTPTSVTANPAIIFDSGSGGRIELDAGVLTMTQSSVAADSLGITLAAGVPYFILISNNGPAGKTIALVKRLDTGQVTMTTTSTSVEFLASTTIYLGNFNGSGFACNCSIAALYWSPLYYQDRLFAFARDPWSLWYPPADEAAPLFAQKAVTKTIFYTSTGTITLPSDFNVANNSIECIGESGNASTGGTVASGSGAGAGAYAKIVNYSANGAGASVAVQVGTGGTATKTIFDTMNNSCVADFGTSAVTTTAGLGGLSANSTGSTKYSGGNGSAGGVGQAGGSGGGAAGQNGSGGNAAASTSGTSGQGGSADNGRRAGALGVTLLGPGNPGIAETPAVWTQTVGGATASPSSGASGAFGISALGAADAGGNAVSYGGAPGGGNMASSTAAAGSPSPGIIVLTYVPISAAAVNWFEMGSYDAPPLPRALAVAYDA